MLTPALIFSAIVFSGAPDHLGDANASQQNGDQSAPQDQRWWLIARVVYMDDTAAQWIMMVATIFAAYLLLRTLWATQEMVRDTRDIGEAQTRAYLGYDFDGANIEVTDTAPGMCRLTIKGRIVNLGASPGRRPECVFRFYLDGDQSGTITVNDHDLINTGGNTTEVMPSGHLKMSLFGPVNATASDVISGRVRVRVVMFIRYEDVFFDTNKALQRTGWHCGVLTGVSDYFKRDNWEPGKSPVHIVWDKVADTQ